VRRDINKKFRGTEQGCNHGSWGRKGKKEIPILRKRRKRKLLGKFNKLKLERIGGKWND
jgi:hypothetical protein